MFERDWGERSAALIGLEAVQVFVVRPTMYRSIEELLLPGMASQQPDCFDFDSDFDIDCIADIERT